MKGVILTISMLAIISCTSTAAKKQKIPYPQIQEGRKAQQIGCIERLLKAEMISEQARLSCEEIFKRR